MLALWRYLLVELPIKEQFPTYSPSRKPSIRRLSSDSFRRLIKLFSCSVVIVISSGSFTRNRVSPHETPSFKTTSILLFFYDYFQIARRIVLPAQNLPQDKYPSNLQFFQKIKCSLNSLPKLLYQ